METIGIILIVLNCLGIGAIFGAFGFYRWYLTKADGMVKRFDEIARAAESANQSQAKKIIEMNDRINSLSMNTRMKSV